MKHLIILFPLLLAISSYSQTQTIDYLVELGNKISKPYNESLAAAASLDNLTLDLVAKGYALSGFSDTTELISGNRLKAKSIHLFTGIANGTDGDKINVLTTMNDGSGYTFSVKIFFYTNNFSTYQKWINDIKTTAGYSNFNLNSSGQYLYRNTQTGKTITIGMSGRYELSGGAPGSSTQSWQADNPFKYYCLISYN